MTKNNLIRGLFRFSSRRRLQWLTRFTWELPQTCVGFLYAVLVSLSSREYQIVYLDGVTYLVVRRGGVWFRGVSLGCFVVVWVSAPLPACTKEALLRSPCAYDFMHEYGHTVDSQRWGPLYLPVIGLPSLSLVGYDVLFNKNIQARAYCERSANRRAAGYFGRHYGVVWDDARWLC